MNIKHEAMTIVKARKLMSVFFQLLLFLMILSASRSYGQEVKISAKEMSLESVFKAVEKQTGLITMYSNDELDAKKRKQFAKHNYDLEDLYTFLLKGEKLHFEITKKYVIIKPILSEKVQETAKPRKETEIVIGKVVDGSGQATPGVTVPLKGTKIATSSDYGGNFKLTIPKDDNYAPAFVFSIIGKPAVERFFYGDKNWVVQLKDGESEITEVVVTGFQRINKRQLTSAVNTVKVEDIWRPDVSSIDQMLEGQVPDMMFMSNSGEVGVVPKLRIRGTSSLIGNREPLWVVDGIVVQDPVKISPEELNDPDYINRIGNAIAGLNPQDIERLDVLKDASATALYGTKAANGVIVVTTKRGRKGRPMVQYGNSMTYKLRPRYTDKSIYLMDSKERMQFSKDLFSLQYRYPSVISWVGYEGLLKQLYDKQIDQSEFDKQVQRLETMNTDWFSLLTEDSFSHQHTLSMNGGSDQSRYYASIGYTANNDVIKSNKNDRYSAMLNLDTEFNKWFSASFGLNGNVSSRDYYQQSIAPMDYAYNTSRAIPAYDDNGEYAFYTRNVTALTGYKYNVMNELENSSYEQNISAITVNTNLRFKFLDWLTGNAIAAYTATSTGIDNYWGDKTFYAAGLRSTDYGTPAPSWSLLPQGGEWGQETYRNNSYTVRLQLDANKYFGEDSKHNISGGVGYEMASTRYVGHSAISRGYYKDRGKSFVSNVSLTDYPAYGNWLASNTPKLKDDLNNLMSFYGTATYGFKRLFYVNANARVDGSNRFGSGSNKKFLPIWSVSGSLNVSEIGNLQSVEWLDFLNFKASYGYQGNMLDSESPILIIKKNPLDSYYGEYTATANNNPNPNLKWEKTNSTNFGAEASLFNNKVQLEGSLYFKRTNEAFMQKTISTVNGRDSYIINSGVVDNNGYSVSMTLSPIKKEDWRWTFTTSFSRTINTLKSKPDAEQYELSNFLNGTALVKDKAVGTFYSYRFLGLSATDGGPLFDDYEDRPDQLVGLSKYDTYTKVLEASGNREPIMAGGLNTSLRYKQFRIAAMFAYSLGAKTRLFGMYTNAASPTMNADEIRPENNVSRDFLDRWQQPGDERHTVIPAIISPSSAAFYKYKDHFSDMTDNVQQIATNYWDMYDYSNLRVVSSNYLKLSSLNFTYELPTEWLKRYSLSRLALSLTGNNLYTWSAKGLRGQTPTQGGFSQIQLSDRPSFSFGINVSF
ncbi:MAG: SusC/RagA family TonB-linked outer membrane protein [Sphingobacterium sp.]|jgi:TonB-linked SusC/RagA family outer membrane protein|nr:SusC/RagA family TonB-linked outer membrane protein [Sphingobacterium sp.]